ncbi:hypothetical protein DMB66_24135 [Actinoplanes sp. ATCC 53533]|uniref:DUF2157 domain-containing protein n=1 Tax=Actinoplanes sp. ATCC 53533 TaxID=1288362 RepID=UPI000F7B301C|nr:DUF2157 domain-containing protein [Actinoplanes sp. ATCC 53533]RSM61623.1 hypothetical protein DMB66_24135 [Actinoplanes sp. ATCC 53533]
MELPSDPSVPPPGQVSAALDRLVERGVLDRSQAGEVLAELAAPPRPPRPQGLGRLFGEIAGYLGASFVVGATILFLGEEWEVLGRVGRFWILAAMAAILGGSGLAIRWRAAPRGSAWWRHRPGDNVSRRLSSTLLTGAAAAAGFAAYVSLERAAQADGQLAADSAGFVASVTGLAVVIVGYLIARSAVGQLGIAVAAWAVYATLLDLLGGDDVAALGLGTLALGAVWALLAWQRLVAERRFALALAVTFGLIGAQLVVADGAEAANFLGYALTALVAGVCFAAYAWTRDWVVLAGGVVGATLVVPEFLYDVTDGSLGASGVLLVAGVTLLAGSLAGLRMRRNPRP